MHKLIALATSMGNKFVGIVVMYRGRQVTVSGNPGSWEAMTLATPEEVEEHDVFGFGATPEEAMDACVDEADLVEGDDDEADEE